MRNNLYNQKMRSTDINRVRQIEVEINSINDKLTLRRREQRGLVATRHRDNAESVAEMYISARSKVDQAFGIMKELHSEAVAALEQEED